MYRGYNFRNGRLKTDASGFDVDLAFMAHMQISATDAVIANNTAVHAALATSLTLQTVNTAITSPTYPKNITATAGGVATDIKAVQVVVTGTNSNNEVITETLPLFTVDTAGTVVGNKAFKTVTSYVVPAMDGVTATVSIGFGTKLGIPYKLPHNTVDSAFLATVKESTSPTVTTSSTAIDGNTIALASALNGTAVDIYLKV